MLLTSLPLVLDLDGTLIRTDTFYEMRVALLHKKPWLLFLIPFWFLRGRAFVKTRLAQEVNLNPADLPYNSQVLTFARQEAEKGRILILATGTPQKVAEKIADYLGIFQEVIGSDDRTNMIGKTKTKALLERFGIKGFDYVGDSRADLHVWKVAHVALVVSPKWGVVRRLRSLRTEEQISYF